MKTNNPDQTERMVLADRPDYLLCIFFLIVWLAPMTWVGLTHRSIPVAGKYLNNLYRVAGLFTKKVNNWSDYYCQIRLEGETDWRDLPESYSAMKTFGDRSRLFFVVSNSLRAPNGMDHRQRMAEYVRQRFERDHPQFPKVLSVRFLHVTYPCGAYLVRQRRAWKTWPLAQVPQRLQRPLSMHFFNGWPARGIPQHQKLASHETSTDQNRDALNRKTAQTENRAEAIPAPIPRDQWERSILLPNRNDAPTADEYVPKMKSALNRKSRSAELEARPVQAHQDHRRQEHRRREIVKSNEPTPAQRGGQDVR